MTDRWTGAAPHWAAWGPPLRPSPEDLAVYAAWARPGDTVLWGVTPELVALPWPGRLWAVDRSPAMIAALWPGDDGRRQVRRAEWGECADLPPATQLVGDGCFANVPFPGGWRRLFAAARARLATPEDGSPAGRAIFRLFLRPEAPEPVAAVEAALPDIVSFHAFKLRLAMALQGDASAGVAMHAVQAQARRLPLGRWPAAEVATLDNYLDQPGRLHFPSLRELRAALEGLFRVLEIHQPAYELGERCPILVLEPLPRGPGPS